MGIPIPGHYSVNIDGIPQEYEVRGRGPVCLALSGGPGIDGGYLRLPSLEKQLTLVYPTQIGTTEASRLPAHPYGYKPEVYSRFIEVLVDHLDVPKVWVLGHSAGGLFSLGYALARPDKVAGLILYATTPVLNGEFWEENGQRVEEFKERFAGDARLPRVLEGWEELHNITDDASFTQAMNKLLPMYFAHYWAREHEFSAGSPLKAVHVINDGEPFDYRERLKDVNAPTLVLAGRYDFVCGPVWAHRLHAAIKGSSLEIFEDSGHFVHLEEPGRFTRAIADFILHAS